MKNRSFATLGLLALLATTSAFGQHTMRADVPFEFHIGDKVMPAGQYEVNRSFSGIQGMLHLSCYESRANAVAKTSNVGGGNAPTESRLVFTKYGDTYFLSEAWSSNSGVGSALAKSKSEREIARRASLAPTRQIVLAGR